MDSATAWASLNAGLLPKWLLLVAITSAGNSIQAYSTLRFTSEIYQNAPGAVTPLTGRVFGTYTFLAAIIRFYAALNIHDPLIYQLAIATYGVAWVHFVSEWLVFKSAKLGRALAGPLIVSNATLVWMFMVWGSYVP